MTKSIKVGFQEVTDRERFIRYIHYNTLNYYE